MKSRTITPLLSPAGDEPEAIEILKIREFNEEAFAEVVNSDGRIVWERVSSEEAQLWREKLKYYRVTIKRRPGIDFALPASPVIRLDHSGIAGYGSNLLYKGIGEDGRPQYCHIPTGTILTEDVNYARRQMRDTFLRLEKWRLSGGFLGFLRAWAP